MGELKDLSRNTYVYVCASSCVLFNTLLKSWKSTVIIMKLFEPVLLVGWVFRVGWSCLLIYSCTSPLTLRSLLLLLQLLLCVKWQICSQSNNQKSQPLASSSQIAIDTFSNAATLNVQAYQPTCRWVPKLFFSFRFFFSIFYLLVLLFSRSYTLPVYILLNSWHICMH